MKLGLLVVLAVAILVPSLSESRIISKCELKERLGEAIEVYLPWRLQRFKERIVKIVVCKLMRLSNLNTGLVKVHGKRRTTTTARPTTTRPTTTETTTTRPTTTEATTTRPTTTEATTTTTTTTRPTTTEATTTTTTTAETTTSPTTIEATTTSPTTTTTTTTTRPTTTRPTTIETTTTRPTTTEATTTTTTTTRPTTTETTTTTTTTAETTTRPTTAEATTTTEVTAPESGAPPSTLEPNRTATETDSRRKKREADSDETEDSKEQESNLEEILNQEANLFDEEEMDSDEESDEDDEDEEDSQESGKRKKRFVPRRISKKRRTWSLGFYGLFQLSDNYFCDSGYRWSHNRCQTSCSAFTDDDITDDIDCFVRTGYWWKVLRSHAFRSCHHVAIANRHFRHCN